MAAVSVMHATSTTLVMERARLDGALEAIHDIAGLAGAIAAIDGAKRRFLQIHRDEADAAGWVL